MRGEEFRAREKKVQKLTRDGLVEQNKTTGEERRVSQRTADIAFGPVRFPTQEAGPSAPKRRKQPRPADAPDPAEGIPDVSSEMRDAADAPAPPAERTKSRQRSAAHGSAPPDTRTAMKKRQVSRLADHAAKPVSSPAGEDTAPRQGRLRFSEEELPPRSDGAETSSASRPSGGGTDGEKFSSRRQRRQYQKAERRVEQASHKLERAQAKLPAKHRARLETQYDAQAGKVRHRLQFEKEAIPEDVKPALPKRAGATLARTGGTAAALKAHQKLREVERDNVAVEAAHKTEFLAERGTGRLLRWNRRRLRSKPYRAVSQARRELHRAEADLAWHTALRDNPALRQKHALTKWHQKRIIQRKYAQTAREAQKSAQHTHNLLTATGKVVRSVAHYAAAHKTALGVVALLVLVMVLFSSGLASCTTMLSGIQASYISTSYLANEEDICNSDLYYTELETDLEIDIANTEQSHPGYDEYRYNIGEISHNPYELMGYLSTVYNAFTFAQVQSEIERLFGEQYTLTRTEITETRYDEDGNTYEWRVLQTTLTVRTLSAVIAESLTDGEQTDRYGVYLQTYGNRQAFGNPFDFPWLGYVSSSYGWRVHPTTGEKNLHRGIDIAVTEGTPIRAVQDGRVVSAGEAGAYGLCVVIEDDKGYQSRYAHCSGISVSVGQEVQRGDVIAAVGSTGRSTGPHLHLEVMLNGEYLNPYYFVDNGGDGAASGSDIPDYSGEPVGDGTFAAMLAEAEKFLGYPYVWGGSSPSTSFDCSGYVSWVINHSGWNVGRLGATGLYNICTPVSRSNAQPGDLIFFTGTYSTSNPVTHVGIYVGNGQMLHCGDPISYANINTSYWTAHFYGFGRLP